MFQLLLFTEDKGMKGSFPVEIIILGVVNLDTKSKQKCGCRWYKIEELGDEVSLKTIIPLWSRLG